MRASDYDNPALRGLCDRCGHVLWAEDESRAIPGMHEACAERELEEERRTLDSDQPKRYS